MSLPQLRVLTFAVIRGCMPLGVAQILPFIKGKTAAKVIRGCMPLGVAQSVTFTPVDVRPMRFVALCR